VYGSEGLLLTGQPSTAAGQTEPEKHSSPGSEVLLKMVRRDRLLGLLHR
jgi:hypothetical protein